MWVFIIAEMTNGLHRKCRPHALQCTPRVMALDDGRTVGRTSDDRSSGRRTPLFKFTAVTCSNLNRFAKLFHSCKGINLQQNSYNVLHQIFVYSGGIDNNSQISYNYGLLTYIVLPPGEWICNSAVNLFFDVVVHRLTFVDARLQDRKFLTKAL